MIYKLGRYIVALLFFVIGYVASYPFMPLILDIVQPFFQDNMFFHKSSVDVVISFSTGIIFFIIGLIFAPLIIKSGIRITKNLERILSRFSGQDLLFGTIGLAFGLIISNLIGLAFHNIPIVGPYIPVILSAILGYLGMHLMIRKRKEIIDYWDEINIIPAKYNRKKDIVDDSVNIPYVNNLEDIVEAKLLDTSVVIDGRIADICHTGFLEGKLVAPLFVLEELQRISDSSDTLKRNRGRRGLDILQEMQDDPNIDIELIEVNYDDINEVDSKLMRLALDRGWKIITNDFNLNKVATLQGISVLNLNDLANALKPVCIPGETMTVHIVKEGKENRQGIAYLEDGTMIVVEQGSMYVNETIPVVVTSILQTRAGRMIFTRPEGVKA